jgi:aspartyl-tRNA(Asn)/glutamyl-tRNA(Gln) amidotransferase subunit B
MRTKEEAHDYRYFPEPDIPPVVVDDEMLEQVKKELPEMPDVRKERFMNEYEMSTDDAQNLTENRYLADYYEQVVNHTQSPKASSSLVLTEVLRVLNEKSIEIRQFSLSPERLGGLIALRNNDKISSSAMTEIFDAMVDGEKSAEAYAKEMNLMQVSDSGFLNPIIDEVIAEHPDEVQRYKEGKKGLIGFFIGQVMQRSQGKANPQMVHEMVDQKLDG